MPHRRRGLQHDASSGQRSQPARSSDEAINTLLPVAQIGGEIAGARLMTLHGIPGGLAGATVLVDMLLQVITQFTFTLVGIGLLALSGGDTSMLAAAMAGMIAMAIALMGFFGVQRFGASDGSIAD